MVRFFLLLQRNTSIIVLSICMSIKVIVPLLYPVLAIVSLKTLLNHSFILLSMIRTNCIIYYISTLNSNSRKIISIKNSIKIHKVEVRWNTFIHEFHLPPLNTEHRPSYPDGVILMSNRSMRSKHYACVLAIAHCCVRCVVSCNNILHVFWIYIFCFAIVNRSKFTASLYWTISSYFIVTIFSLFT